MVRGCCDCNTPLKLLSENFYFFFGGDSHTKKAQYVSYCAFFIKLFVPAKKEAEVFRKRSGGNLSSERFPPVVTIYVLHTQPKGAVHYYQDTGGWNSFFS